jgi:hypothetical protein
MQQSGSAVLVFDRGGDVLVFSELQDAEAYMESIDVLDGEYEGAFTTHGNVVDIAGVRDGPVSLRVTLDRDDVRLRELLLKGQSRLGFVSNVDDTVSVANELMRMEWERSWPRRPIWLRRRLRGDEPPQI